MSISSLLDEQPIQRLSTDPPKAGEYFKGRLASYGASTEDVDRWIVYAQSHQRADDYNVVVITQKPKKKYRRLGVFELNKVFPILDQDPEFKGFMVVKGTFRFRWKSNEDEDKRKYLGTVSPEDLENVLNMVKEGNFPITTVSSEQ